MPEGPLMHPPYTRSTFKHLKHLFLRLKHPTIESGAHLHTEEPPEAPSMYVKDLRAYEAPVLPLKDPEVL